MSAPAAELDPMALLAGLVLEDGRPWGDVAHPWQWHDAAAVLGASHHASPATPDPTDVPRRHFLLRGRGMSKTTDVAGLALVLLLTLAPARSRSHVYAVDAEQAAIMADTIAGLVQRSHVAGLVDVGPRTVTVRSTGATLTIESSDGASAYGARPWLTVCDELGLWPSTANHRALWAAITSAVPKVPGSRLVAIGTAGSPVSLGAKVWADAAASEHWHTSVSAGPAPWWTPADVDATRASLTASEWRRLIACEWAEGDDALTTAEDVAACIRPGSAALAPVRGTEYVAALDVGTRRDLTALAIGHAERREVGRVTVIDRVMYWRPSSSDGRRVDLADVEAATLRLCREYRVRRLRFDRMQAEQLTGNLARAGVTTSEYVFSASGAHRLARGLYGALRDRALELPDDDELRDEAASVRMVETGPSTVKMMNPPGTHDDVLTAIGMVLVDLSERPESGGGRITVPTGSIEPRTNHDARPGLSLAHRVRKAVEAQTPAQRAHRVGLLVPGSANDPRRQLGRSWGR